MEITKNYIEATGPFTRHGFIVTPAPTMEGRDDVEEDIIANHGVVGPLVHCDWDATGSLVEVVTEYDPEDYWTD